MTEKKRPDGFVVQINSMGPRPSPFTPNGGQANVGVRPAPAPTPSAPSGPAPSKK